MSTRGILIIGQKVYDINHDADIYAKTLFTKVWKEYKPGSAKEFIKIVNEIYDVTGRYIMVSPRPYSIPASQVAPDPIFDEAVIKVNLTTGQVKMRKLRMGVTKLPKF